MSLDLDLYREQPYRAEYASSGRSRCNQCPELISENELRFARVEPSQHFDGKLTKNWYHFQCFFNQFKANGIQIEEIAHYAQLRYDDQTLIRQEINRLDISAGRAIKRLKVVDTDRNEALEEQSNMFYENFNFLQTMNKMDLKDLMDTNCIESTKRMCPRYERLADAMTFGRLEPCSECESQLVFRLCGYICSGNGTEWSKCRNQTLKPKRLPFEVPIRLAEKYDFLNKYEYVERERIYNPWLALRISEPKAMKDNSSDPMTVKLKGFSEPNANLCSNSDEKPIHDLNSSNESASDKSTKRVELMSNYYIYTDGNERFEAVLIKVDVSTGKNSYYNIKLLVVPGTNLVHKLEKNVYIVLRAWGRIGTDIGRSVANYGDKGKADNSEFESLTKAIEFFKKIYFQKTNNEWRNGNNFVKYENYYFHVDIDFSAQSTELDLKPGNSAFLSESVQRLICMLFSVENMKKQMIDYDIDLESYPLGKLSKQSIDNGFSVLEELRQSIKADYPNKDDILEANNRFYSYIPHNFGSKHPSIIDNEDTIESKRNELRKLSNIELTNKMINSVSIDDKDVNEIELFYRKLNSKIEPLNRESEEFDLILKYLSTTQGPTHDFSLELSDVFTIERNGESNDSKYMNQKRMLLWHGSRATNYPSILSQGLSICPTDARAAGSTFGAGIYFADVVTKSTRYCKPEKFDNICLLLLCDVVVGESINCKNELNIKALPKCQLSCKAMGTYQPNPQNSKTLKNGVEVPLGPLVSGPKLKLLYNEYVVYNADQIKIKYLVKCDYKPKSNPISSVQTI